MKIVEIKSEPRFKAAVDKKAGWIEWDSNNNYPNIIKQVAQASPTAQKCLNTYVRFLVGKGFTDLNLNKFIVDPAKRTTSISLLRRIAYDRALLKGVAVHIDYKAEGTKYALKHVPFENCRLGKPDDMGYINRIITNKDFLEYKKENNQSYYNYDLTNVIKQITGVIAKHGSVKYYRGQIYWWSTEGLTYPIASIDSVKTDCSTEEGLSNIRYRNTRYNFLPAGMLATIGKPETDNVNPAALTEEQRIDLIAARANDNFEKKFVAAQGDTETSKIMVVSVNFKEEIPTFIPFDAKNFDKEFLNTENSTTNVIGGIFNQPPILRCEDVGAGFGADAIINAYNFYNAILETERIELSEIFKELMTGFEGASFQDYTITPLTYQNGSTNNI